MSKSKEVAIKFLKSLKELGIKGYLVGGGVRDYLVFNDFSDIDVAIKGNKDTLKMLLTKFDTSSVEGIYYGVIKVFFEGEEIEVSLLRKEGEYVKNRRPKSVEFDVDVEIDYLRRDFTINALYLDENFNLIDFTNGKEDLDNKVLRVIGDSSLRLREDALRILRAIRFMVKLDLKMDEKLVIAIKENAPLVYKLPLKALEKEKNKLLEIISLQEAKMVYNSFNLDWSEIYG